jgi:hypothetical protein
MTTSRKILIEVGDLSVEAELNESKTAEKILDLLPFESAANVWGDEIYFEIPLELPLEAGARAEVEIGEMAYWPSGRAFCIFFGPTPVSTGDQPRAYSPVNVFGSVKGDATVLRGAQNGDAVRVQQKHQGA